MTTNTSLPPPAVASARPARLLPATLVALAVVAIWGASFAVIRGAIREVPPFLLAFLRFALASLLLLPSAWPHYRRVKVAPEDRWPLFALGFVGVTIYFAFENCGLMRTTASHGALIVATIPLASALAEAVRLRRRPAPVMLGGLLTALAGVWLIVGGDEGGGATVLGDLLMVGAVAAWIWYTFLAVRIGDRYPDVMVSHLIMVVGAVTLLPPALLEIGLSRVAFPSLQAWSAVAFLGVFCSALGYHYWNQSIRVLGATAANNLLNGIPLVGVATGVAFLGEPLTWEVGLGGALILGGVVVAGLVEKRAT